MSVASQRLIFFSKWKGIWPLMREMLKNLLAAYKIFSSTGGSIIASSSAFSLLLTIVPMALLLIRVVGFFVGDISLSNEKIFILSAQFLPGVAPDLVVKMKTIITELLKGKSTISLVNFLMLVWSSLLFLNSIWHGLYLLTGDRSYRSFRRHFKGLAIILISVLLLGVTLTLPMAISFVEALIRKNFFTAFIFEHFPAMAPVLNEFLTMGLFTKLLVKSNLLHILILLPYFAFLYRWFLSDKISLKVAGLGASVFVASFCAGKFLFYLYVFYLRNNYVDNYGDYYTFLLSLIWLFIVICFFFYGVCVCKVFHQAEVARKGGGLNDKSYS